MTQANRPIVLFDGKCGFCTWSVNFARASVHADVDFVPYQSVDVSRFGLTVEQCAAAVQFVGPGGAVAGERAVARVLESGGAAWKPVGRLIGSPPIRPIAAAVYRFVARHRGRLWGVEPPL